MKRNSLIFCIFLAGICIYRLFVYTDILSVFLDPMAHQFLFVNEYSFCPCRHCQLGQGFELHLWQPDWESNLSGITGNFLSAPALFPGHICRLFCPGPGTADDRWHRAQQQDGKSGVWCGSWCRKVLMWQNGQGLKIERKVLRQKLRHRPLFSTLGTIDNLGLSFFGVKGLSCEFSFLFLIIIECWVSSLAFAH